MDASDDGGFKHSENQLVFKFTTHVDDLRPRLGCLSMRGRKEIQTPCYFALSSRGVVPHITQDMMKDNLSISGLYTALEDCESPQIEALESATIMVGADEHALAGASKTLRKLRSILPLFSAVLHLYMSLLSDNSYPCNRIHCLSSGPAVSPHYHAHHPTHTHLYR